MIKTLVTIAFKMFLGSHTMSEMSLQKDQTHQPCLNVHLKTQDWKFDPSPPLHQNRFYSMNIYQIEPIATNAPTNRNLEGPL